MQLLLSSRMRSKSIREVVFGVEDGVVQNMTLVAGMVGGGLSSRLIIFAGSVNAIAGVLAMSMGAFLSSQAERDVALANERRFPGTGGPATVRSPLQDAAVMAGAYAAGAIVPLVPFALGGGWMALVIAVALTAVALFALGVGKAIASEGRPVRSGLQMLSLASAAGLLGFLVGVLARTAFGLDF